MKWKSLLRGILACTAIFGLTFIALIVEGCRGQDKPHAIEGDSNSGDPLSAPLASASQSFTANVGESLLKTESENQFNELALFKMMIQGAAHHYSLYKSSYPGSLDDLYDSGLFPFTFKNILTGEDLVCNDNPVEPGDLYFEEYPDGSVAILVNGSDASCPVEFDAEHGYFDTDYYPDAGQGGLFESVTAILCPSDNISNRTGVATPLDELHKTIQTKEALRAAESFLNSILQIPVVSSDGTPKKFASLDDFRSCGIDFSKTNMFDPLTGLPVKVLDRGVETEPDDESIVVWIDFEYLSDGLSNRERTQVFFEY